MTLIALRKGRDDGRSGIHESAKRGSRELAGALRAGVRGEVRFDGASRAIYSTDASNYRQVPIGVVIPRDIDDVVASVAACRAFGAPIVSRGGATSLAGQTCNAAVVLDFSKYMNRVLEIDPDQRFARVEPGLALDDLRNATERFHLTLPPDPATHAWNSLGGMIGNNSCGIHSVMGGPHAARTGDYIEELVVLTYDGEMMRVGAAPDGALEHIIHAGGARGRIHERLLKLRDRYAALIRERYPDIPRRVSGYNLDELLPEKGFHVARALAGTEGTCVIVLEAKMRLLPSPRARVLVVLGYPDVYAAGDHVMEILEFRPIGLEGLDRKLIEYLSRKHIAKEDVAILPPGEGWLLAEMGGDTHEEAEQRAKALCARLEKAPRGPSVKILSPEDARKIWEIRESGLAATAHVPGMRATWPGWEDSAVPPDKLGHYLRSLRGLLDRFGYECALYGHFGQGCVHCRIDFDLQTRPGIDHYLRFVSEAADLVVSLGGSISGEHGDGQARAALLEKMYGKELVSAFREFKSIWDPSWKMNPGKVVDPHRIDENLRLGERYAPLAVETHFEFPEDGGSFADATLRCVGVGKCRRVDTGTMCPSYMVTREEKHTTRGRARALFEMLNGDETPRGWDNPDVKDALDLCLSCKGCKGECPVHVDMATYKAEFLSHYYEHHRRPMAAFAMGLIRTWARLASFAPRLANAILHAPILGTLLKRLGGIAMQRELPRFARRTFKRWFFSRNGSATTNGKPVILWADTWSDHFHPEVAISAVRVLEASGHRVLVPRGSLCCGRPLYDYGMIDRAKRNLEQILETLRPAIREGVPVVGLEPSCVSVFRDELVGLFPHDEDAKRLASQSFLLAELLESEGFTPPRLDRKAIVHGHCHEKSVLRFAASTSLLKKAGVDCEVVDSGCCGMAGSFGYEAQHYEISRAIGERALLPAVRSAGAETLVVTDGFSCRQQIEAFTGRRPVHVAEVLDMAIQKQTMAQAAPRPLRRRPAARMGALPAAATVAAGIALGIGVFFARAAVK